MPGGRRFTATLLLGGLVAGGLLTSCTDDPDPGPSPPPSSAASPTPSPTRTLKPPTPPRPKRTPANAEAFVRYFWASYNYAYATLDASAIKRISEAECRFCRSLVQQVEGLREERARTEGMRVRVRFVAAPPMEKPRRIAVVTVIDQDSGKVIRADGTEQLADGADKTKSLAGLHWKNGSWHVYGISLDKDDDQ